MNAVLLDTCLLGNQTVCVAHCTVARLGDNYMSIAYMYLALYPGRLLKCVSPMSSLATRLFLTHTSCTNMVLLHLGGAKKLFMRAVCTSASEESLQKIRAADLISTCTSLRLWTRGQFRHSCRVYIYCTMQTTYNYLLDLLWPFW